MGPRPGGIFKPRDATGRRPTSERLEIARRLCRQEAVFLRFNLRPRQGQVHRARRSEADTTRKADTGGFLTPRPWLSPKMDHQMLRCNSVCVQ